MSLALAIVANRANLQDHYTYSINYSKCPEPWYVRSLSI